MIDFEKVDMNLLSLIQQLNNLENFMLLPSMVGFTNVSNIVSAIDALRFEVSAEIERQGTVVSE